MEKIRVTTENIDIECFFCQETPVEDNTITVCYTCIKKFHEEHVKDTYEKYKETLSERLKKKRSEKLNELLS